MQDLREALSAFGPLTDAAWAATQGLLCERPLAAGAHLLRAGEPARRFCFVRRGLLREYYADDQGREFTRHFAVAGEFSGSLADLLSPGPARASIDALSDSLLLEGDWQQLDRLAGQHPCLMKLLRHVAESLYLRKARREFEMLSLTATARYRSFIEQYPGLDARLHRHQVASYLGITPVHLSRISGPAASRRRNAAT